MKFKMAEKSLFAVLLRSPWWTSVGIALAIVVLDRVLLPSLYVPFGMVSGLPFLVIGGIASWREFSDRARRYATEHSIRVMLPAELAQQMIGAA